MRIEEEIKQPAMQDPFLKAVVNVLLTADRISHATNATLKPFGISKEQYNVLRILRGQHPEPSPLQLIAERMISESSNASRLVDKLCRKGLVDRSPCAENRRKVDILITQAGLALLAEADPLVKASSNQMRHLTDDEARQLNRLLDKMRG